MVDDRRQRVPRVQRRVRVLEDDLYLSSHYFGPGAAIAMALLAPKGHGPGLWDK